MKKVYEGLKNDYENAEQLRLKMETMFSQNLDIVNKIFAEALKNEKD